MRPENIIIGIILLTLIVIGFSGLVGELSNDYNVASDTSFNATYGQIDEMTTKTQALANKTQGTKLSSVYDIPSSGLAVISLLWDSLGLLNTMLEELSVEIGLPAWFIGGIMAIITVLLIFIIINYTFRYDPR